MLELVDVRAGYGRTEVVHGVSLTVPEGGVAAVMGHNGARLSCQRRHFLRQVGRHGGR